MPNFLVINETLFVAVYRAASITCRWFVACAVEP